MSLLKEAEAYIQKHAVNLGTDTIQHLKTFAATVDAKATALATEAKPEAAKIETDVKAEVSEVPSDIQHAETAVESAAEEVKQHAEHAFADLLAAQSKPAA